MNKNNFYFRQKVTEAELDSAIGASEVAQQIAAVDTDFAQKVDGSNVPIVTPLTADFNSIKGGIVTGLNVSIAGLVATVSTGVAYDGRGRRIEVTTPLSVDLSATGDTLLETGGTPTGGFSTSVPSGQFRWISLFIYFDRKLSDPRTDGNNQTVYFAEDESFHFRVKAGNPASSAPVKPSPDADLVLLGDFERNDANAIAQSEYNRRGDWIRMSGTSPSNAPPTVQTEDGTSTDPNFIAGSARDAIVKLRNLVVLATGNYLGHINQSTPVDRHAAKNFDFAATPSAWADGTNPAIAAKTGGGLDTNGVQGAINALIGFLVATTSIPGTGRVGSATTTSGSVTISAGTLASAITQIVTRLAAHIDASSGAHAASAITATTGGVRPSGTVQGQLQNLDDNKANTTFGAMFGDGSDGDVTLNTSGDTTLTRVMYYNNLTLAGGRKIHTMFPIFVRGTLTIDGSTGSYIDEYPIVGGNSKNGTAASGGGAGGVGTNSTAFDTHGCLLGGGSGGNGGVSGQNGAAGKNTTNSLGGNGGVGYDSNTGGFTGGAAGVAAFVDNTAISGLFSTPSANPGYIVSRNSSAESSKALNLIGLMGGAGGGGGGARAGVNGGGGGAGGGILIIYANNVTINLNNVLRATGGQGGDGDITNISGGGGGGGGSVILGYRKLTLTSGATNPFLVVGGGGGTTFLSSPTSVGADGTSFLIDLS